MKIVILDAYTENPGDLSWKALEQFGELTVYASYGEKNRCSCSIFVIKGIREFIIVFERSPCYAVHQYQNQLKKGETAASASVSYHSSI